MINFENSMGAESIWLVPFGSVCLPCSEHGGRGGAVSEAGQVLFRKADAQGMVGSASVTPNGCAASFCKVDSEDDPILFQCLETSVNKA